MSITTKCECGKKYKVSDSHFGKKLRCKACGETFTVSAPPAEEKSDAPQSQTPATPKPETPKPVAASTVARARTPLQVPEHNPDDLLKTFSRSRMLFGISVAVALHVFIVGFSSMGFITDTWIDPEGAAERKKLAEAEQKRELQAKAEAVKAAKLDAKKDGEAQGEKADEKKTAEKKGEKSDESKAAEKKGEGEEKSGYVAQLENLRKQHPDSEVVKKITEMPKKGEVPAAPDKKDLGLDDDLDLDVSDTNMPRK